MLSVPYHAQDTACSCGAACIQMLLHWQARQLGPRGLFAADQAALYERANQVATSPSVEQSRSESDFINAFQLAAVLNERSAAVDAERLEGPEAHPALWGPWVVVEQPFVLQSEPGTVLAALHEALAQGWPCAVALHDPAHWVILAEHRVDDQGDDWYSLLNPWLTTDAAGLDPRPHFPHREDGLCPCGPDAPPHWIQLGLPASGHRGHEGRHGDGAVLPLGSFVLYGDAFRHRPEATLAEQAMRAHYAVVPAFAKAASERVAGARVQGMISNVA
jgi:Papain-like cysteine protease AvrRpt2